MSYEDIIYSAMTKATKYDLIMDRLFEGLEFTGSGITEFASDAYLVDAGIPQMMEVLEPERMRRARDNA